MELILLFLTYLSILLSTVVFLTAATYIILAVIDKIFGAKTIDAFIKTFFIGRQ